MTIAQDQEADFTAARIDQTFVVAVDTTSRQYDLSAIDLGTKGSDIGNPGVTKGRWIYVTIQADGAAVYYAFSDTAGQTISETGATVAGATPSFATNRCWKIPADTQESVRIDRQLLRYLYLKGAGAGYARIRCSCTPPAAGQA